MPTVDVYNQNREAVGQVDLRDDVFDVKVREHLFHCGIELQD